MTTDEKIIAALDNLLKADPEDEPILINPEIYSSRCRLALMTEVEKSWETSPASKALLDLLKSDEKIMETFDERLHAYGRGDACYFVKDVANWLVRRSESTSSIQAIEEVRQFSEASQFKAWAVLFIGGPHIDETHDLGNGVSLVPLNQLPTESLSRYATEPMFGGFSVVKSTGALVFSLNQQRNDVPSTGDHTPKFEIVDTRKLDDALLCLGMCRREGCGIQGLALSVVADDSVPLWKTSVSLLHTFRPPPMMASLIGLETKRARNIYEKFLRLSERDKNRIRLSMRKLNEAAALKFSLVDRAISLRTALESIFMSAHEDSSISRRVRTRGALFLEPAKNVQERKDIEATLRNAYQIGSSAVHNGFLSDKEVRKLGPSVDDAMKLVRKAILMLLDQPNPNWGAIEKNNGATVIRKV